MANQENASPERQFIALLGNAAGYNDKGFQWSGHSPAEVQAMRDAFHRSLVVLGRQIGPERLGEVLWAAIEAGAASSDGSGQYFELAEKVLRR